MAEPRKTAASKEPATTSGSEANESARADLAESQAAPVAAGRSQPGEAVTAPLTNRVPRGVNEPPADMLADEEGARATQEAVNKVVEKETARGYRGYNTDPTPNEAYTLAGVNKGMPTPETVVITPRRVEDE